MKCSDMRRDISSELDGELEQSRALELEKHLEICEDCRSYRSAMIRIYSIHEGLVEAEPPAGLVPSVMSALEDPGRRERTGFWRRLMVPAAAALVVFLGIMAGAQIAEMVSPSNGNGQSDVFGLEYLEELPPGSIGELMMADSEGGNGDEQ